MALVNLAIFSGVLHSVLLSLSRMFTCTRRWLGFFFEKFSMSVRTFLMHSLMATLRRVPRLIFLLSSEKVTSVAPICSMMRPRRAVAYSFWVFSSLRKPAMVLLTSLGSYSFTTSPCRFWFSASLSLHFSSARVFMDAANSVSVFMKGSTLFTLSRVSMVFTSVSSFTA